MEIEKQDGTSIVYDSLHLDGETSVHIFNRTGEIAKIVVHVDESILK